MKTRILLVAPLFLWGYLTQAQTTQVPKKEVVPTSPEASALTKALNYPVSFNTGLPDISVPLYEVESGDLKLPIGLSYHSGGFKINEQSTSVGLGWSLTSDIQITRTINGLDDFKPTNGYLANTKMRAFYENPTTCMGCSYPFYDGIYPGANSIALGMGITDGMPDKFNYHLLNKSGSFYFYKSNDGTTYSVIPVPYDNIKITYSSNKFTIVDSDGTTYYFGTSGAIDLDDQASQGFELSELDFNDYRITAWKCKQIVNATKTESINFTYQTKPVTISSRPVEKIDYYNNPDPCTIGPAINLNNQTQGLNITTYYNLMQQFPFWGLSSPKYFVSFPTYTVFHLPYLTYPASGYVVNDKTFTVDGGLPFLGQHGTYPSGSPGSSTHGLAISAITFRGGSVIFNGTDQLTSMVVKDGANNTVKSVQFNSSYTAEFDMTYPKNANGLNFKGTLYLDNIQFVAAGLPNQQYTFSYKIKTCFGNHLTGSDAWGYFNARTHLADDASATTNVPFKSITQDFHNDTYSPCTISQANAIFNFGNSADTEVPSENNLKRGILTRIIYPTGGYTDFDFEPNLYQEKMSDLDGSAPMVQMGGGLRIRSINSYDGKTLKLQNQKYYRYGVLENGIGLTMNVPPRTIVNGKKVYQGYSYAQDVIYYANPNNAMASTRGALIATVKETHTTYMTASSLDYSYPNGAAIYYTRVTEYNNDMGTQTGKRVYNYYDPPPSNRPMIALGTNIPLLYTDGLMGQQKSVVDYKYEAGKFKLIHSKEFGYTEFKYNIQARVAYTYLKNAYQLTPGGPIFANFDAYDSTSGWGNGSVPMGSDFLNAEYGISAGKMLLTSENEKWVDNTNILTQNTQYGYNYLPYLQPDIITTTNTKGEQIVKNIKYAYNFPGIAIYDQMQSAAVNMISQPVDIKVTNVSKGKELSHTLTNYGTTGATAFIAPLSVQSSVNGNPLETDMSISYNDYANVKQVTAKNGLVKSYLWGYNYKYPIAEFTGIDYATAIGSTDVAAMQTITDENTLRNSLATLRNNNPAAMVKTFTYKPLVGVSTETAPNGLNKFYDYDAFNRLFTIKDRNQFILNRYEYNYRPYNASDYLGTTLVPNVPVMASFIQPCTTTPTTYNTLNYVIPGGKYFAPEFPAANDNAEAELFTSGPSQTWGISGLPMSQFATINMSSFMNSGSFMVGDVYMDFIQDESVVGSNKFPYNTNGVKNGPTGVCILKSGDYKVSFRQGALRGVGIVKYYVTPSTGASFWLKDGASLTLTGGVTYTVQVTNAF
jgi:hypothetical protein